MSSLVGCDRTPQRAERALLGGPLGRRIVDGRRPGRLGLRIFGFAERIPEFGIDTSPAELFGPVIVGGLRLGMLAMRRCCSALFC